MNSIREWKEQSFLKSDVFRVDAYVGLLRQEKRVVSEEEAHGVMQRD